MQPQLIAPSWVTPNIRSTESALEPPNRYFHEIAEVMIIGPF